jgi:hypothetical protein
VGRGWGRGGKNIAHEGGACDLGLGDLHCDKILKWQSAVTWSQARECGQPKTLLSLQNCVWTKSLTKFMSRSYIKRLSLRIFKFDLPGNP